MYDRQLDQCSASSYIHIYIYNVYVCNGYQFWVFQGLYYWILNMFWQYLLCNRMKDKEIQVTLDMRQGTKTSKTHNRENYKDEQHEKHVQTLFNTRFTQSLFVMVKKQIGLIPPHLCACHKSGPGFSTSYIMVFFVLSEFS